MSRRHKDVEWVLPEGERGALANWDHVSRALLMDLRDQAHLQTAALQSIARVLECHNTQAIPRTLKRIDARLREHMPLKRGTKP